jgi:hypothetical protein
MLLMNQSLLLPGLKLNSYFVKLLFSLNSV